tara:strand:- start:106 stop:327 length:222 start_codon:yes stop_codon:yes gene_type:complete
MCFGGSIPKQELPDPPPKSPAAATPLVQGGPASGLAMGFDSGLGIKTRQGRRGATIKRNPSLDMSGLGINYTA